MDRLSDYVLVQLIHRCSLIERLNTTSKRRSKMRRYVAYTNPFGTHKDASMEFLDRYDRITDLVVNSVDMFSLYLSDKVMSGLLRLTVHCQSAYDLTTCDDIPERCTSLERLILVGSDRVLEDAVDVCNEYHSRFSNTVDFRMTSPIPIRFPLIYHKNEDRTIECHKTREVNTRSNMSISGDCIERIGVRTPDDERRDIRVTVGHCPRLVALRLLCMDSIDVFPKTLTQLSLQRASPEQLKEIDLPLEKLYIDELTGNIQNVLVVSDFIPPSVTLLCIDEAPPLDFSGIQLRILSVTSQHITKNVLPQSLTELTVYTLDSDAVSHLKHLKSLACAVSLDIRPIWPDSLTELILMEPVVSTHSEGFDIGDTSHLLLPERLPKCLKYLCAVRPSNSLSIFACPETWTLGQLTRVRFDSVSLTPEQLLSLRCNSIASDNSEEELSTLIEKAQRRIDITPTRDTIDGVVGDRFDE